MSLVLGLDVSSRVVRGAFLRTTLRGSEMEHYAEVVLPETTNEGDPEEAVRQAVNQIVHHGVRAPDRIVASLDGELASLRLIELPAGVAKKVADVLPGELESVLPFDVEDAVVDHQIVDKEGTSIYVMAVAAPKQSVADRLEQLTRAGANPRELAVGAAAFDGLVELLPESLQNRTALVIDIGATSTDFCVLSGGNCVFARTVSGGLDLVESGQRSTLGAALQRTLAGYRAQRVAVPELILLAGDAAPMETARTWLSEQLGMDCGVVPLPMASGAEPDTLPKFSRAAALAARSIGRKKRLDLRQGELASKASAGQIRRHLRLAAVCGVAVVLCFGVSLAARYQVAKAEHEKLSNRLAEVSEDLLGSETTSALHARELLTGGPQSNDPLPRFDAYDVLEAVSSVIPSEISHETRRLKIEIDDEGDDGRLEIQGTVATIAERDRIVDELKGHDCFTEIEKGSISSAANDRKNYKLVVKIECPGGGSPTKRGGGDGVR